MFTNFDPIIREQITNMGEQACNLVFEKGFCHSQIDTYLGYPVQTYIGYGLAGAAAGTAGLITAVAIAKMCFKKKEPIGKLAYENTERLKESTQQKDVSPIGPTAVDKRPSPAPSSSHVEGITENSSHKGQQKKPSSISRQSRISPFKQTSPLKENPLDTLQRALEQGKMESEEVNTAYEALKLRDTQRRKQVQKEYVDVIHRSSKEQLENIKREGISLFLWAIFENNLGLFRNLLAKGLRLENTKDLEEPFINYYKNKIIKNEGILEDKYYIMILEHLQGTVSFEKCKKQIKDSKGNLTEKEYHEILTPFIHKQLKGFMALQQIEEMKEQNTKKSDFAELSQFNVEGIDTTNF